MWREAAALGAVFGLLGVAVWTLRARGRTMRARPGKSLTAVERIVLSPHHALHLVRAPGRELLVATHPQGCSLLVEMPLVEQALMRQPPSQPSLTERVAAERALSKHLTLSEHLTKDPLSQPAPRVETS